PTVRLSLSLSTSLATSLALHSFPTRRSSDLLLKAYIGCIILGSVFGTFLTFSVITWQQPTLVLIIWGTFHGIFNGMLAAALTEVLNVFPVLSKRIGMDAYLLPLLMAIVFGKIAGSLFQWLIFVR